MDRPFFSRIAPLPVAAGTVVAFAAALLLPGGVAASLVGVAAGGLLAARLAGVVGVLQGAAVAVVFIVVSTLVGVPPQPEDTVALALFDLAHLSVGALAGRLGAR